MKPLNAAERQKAFINFLLFFIGTTALILLAVYFGIQVPFRQNEKLRDQIAVFEKERAFAETFTGKMSDTKKMLDTINIAGVQSELMDGKINENLKAMNAMPDRDSVSSKKLYQMIVQNYADLQFAKKQLRDASGKDANLSQSLQTIEQLKNDLQQVKNENLMLRMATQQQQPQLQQPR